MPRTLLLLLPDCDTADRGVCGGVVSGKGDGCAELAAVTSGTEPRVGVGLLTTDAGCWERDGVLLELADVEQAGLVGGTICVALG